MKYGIYYNEEIPSMEDFTNGAHIAVICKIKDYVNKIVNLEDVGWEVRDCIKFFTQGDSLQIALLRKPFKGTVVNNILTQGCGGINIDGCRISFQNKEDITIYDSNRRGPIERTSKEVGDAKTRKDLYDGGWTVQEKVSDFPRGRFPANLLFTDDEGAILDAKVAKSGNKSTSSLGISLGGPSRFFQKCENIDELKTYLKMLIDPEA